MSSLTPAYRPISCEVHDRLEDLATTRQPTRFAYQEADGLLHQCYAVVEDVYSKAGAEYIALSSGAILRLDHLIEIGTEKVSSSE